MELTRNCIQELFVGMWELPVKPSNVGPIASLPEPITPVPREKSLPKEKAETRWEKFAKEKGIKHKKKSSRIWDETTKEWRPRWGMNRINDPKLTWAMDDKPEQLARYNAEDPFQLESLKKKERLEKNQKLQVKNIKRAQLAQKADLPATLDITKNAPHHQKHSIERAVALAQKSTASMGIFDKPHSDEPKIKSKPTYIKKSEMDTTKKIADRVLKKASSVKEVLDVDKATRNEMRNEQMKNKKRKLSESTKGKGKGGGKEKGKGKRGEGFKKKRKTR